jgi:uncharacterized protein YacL
LRKSIFVEIVRLLIVLVLMTAGYGVGARYGTALVGSVFGASIGYVGGGVLGRFLRRATGDIAAQAAHISAAEFLSGTLGALLVGMLAALLALPAVALLPGRWGWPIFCLIVWIGVHGGFRIVYSKTAQLLSLAGLSESSLADPSAAATRDAALIDTSVLADGRLLRLARTGFLHRKLLVPGFVLDELRGLAESQEPPVRRKARGGLESLEAIRRDGLLQVHVLEEEIPEIEDVDAKLVALATRMAVPLLTNDENLGRIAELRGVRCLNLHRLAKSLSSVLTPGELVNVSIVKEGQNEGEGVGYLAEGSMVVVANTAGRVGDDVDVRITTSVRTPRGRIFFATLADD